MAKNQQVMGCEASKLLVGAKTKVPKFGCNLAFSIFYLKQYVDTKFEPWYGQMMSDLGRNMLPNKYVFRS